MTRKNWTAAFPSLTGFQKSILSEPVTPDEESEQARVVEWAGYIQYKSGRLSDYLHHSPNGGQRPTKTDSKGNTYCPEGAKLKRMGTRKGFLDLILPIARGGYIGLFVEMKAKSGKPSPEQKKEIPRMQGEGYQVHVCHSANAAIKVIEAYMSLPPTQIIQPTSQP